MGTPAQAVGGREGGQGRRVLLAVAAPAEIKAVCAAFGSSAVSAQWALTPLDEGFDVVRTGVGKAAAAGGVARTLDPQRHGLVLSIGVAGSLGTGVGIGQTVLADRCELADDGVLSPEGFEGLEKIGFGPFEGGTSGVLIAPRVFARLRPLADATGPVATVSACSGTNAAAAALAKRGFVAEAMEGAAVALVAEHLGVSFAEVRVISNTTGDRAAQRWDLPGSLARLTEVLGRLRAL